MLKFSPHRTSRPLLTMGALSTVSGYLKLRFFIFLLKALIPACPTVSRNYGIIPGRSLRLGLVALDCVSATSVRVPSQALSSKKVHGVYVWIAPVRADLHHHHDQKFQDERLEKCPCLFVLLGGGNVPCDMTGTEREVRGMRSRRRYDAQYDPVVERNVRGGGRSLTRIDRFRVPRFRFLEGQGGNRGPSSRLWRRCIWGVWGTTWLLRIHGW
ncbi:hypothetical protein F5I97DRAFT_1110977 [Phlebopus sp. FC_14]|nr:hypothetical protein F5I97DRAFT_1110977 [Phlebopus sp. FC_14]